MSQVIYTELEGEPVRWPYGKAIPLEGEQEADKTAKTWSVDTTPSTQISNENTGTENQVYGSNQIAQVFKTGENAIKLSAIQLYGRKNGSPQNPLIVELRKAILKEYSKQIVEGNTTGDGYGTTPDGGYVWIAQTYSPTCKIKLIKVEVRLRRYGTVEDVVFEIRDVKDDGTPGGNVLYTDTIPYTEIGSTASWIPVEIDPPFEIQPGEKYAFCFKLAEISGITNRYNYYYEDSDVWSGGDGYKSENGGPWEWLGDLQMKFTSLIDAYIPSDEKLLSLEIDPASFGTSDGWVSKSLDNPIALRPDERYSLVIYMIGGDESNHYIIHSGSESLSPENAMSKSEDSGETWNIVDGQNLSFKLDGVQYQKLYSGIRELLSGLPKAAKPILALKVRAQTSSSMEFCGFDDYTLTAPIVTSTATQQTMITVLSGEDERNRDPGELSQISWEIWGAGDGLASGAYTQYQALFDNPEITPRDLGFTELYLLKAKAEENESLAIINDRAVGALYFQNAGDEFIAPEGFRIPVRKVEVLDGKITFDFIGVE
ncbi:MAG: hypothetical protein J7J28_00010 [Thaumarchaeota archaeon]|nr:hypothetical protein [Nitrososphaerota archaeon]